MHCDQQVTSVANRPLVSQASTTTSSTNASVSQAALDAALEALEALALMLSKTLGLISLALELYSAVRRTCSDWRWRSCSAVRRTAIRWRLKPSSASARAQQHEGLDQPGAGARVQLQQLKLLLFNAAMTALDEVAKSSLSCRQTGRALHAAEAPVP